MVMMVMMVMMVVVLRHPFPAVRLRCGDTGVIRFQGIQCIPNRL
jgi:hypothetical protein